MDCSPARARTPAEWMISCPERSAPMAEKVQDWILSWEPDLTESIKWNCLCFSGRKLVCGLSACQKHLGITFFRGTQLPDPASLFTPADNNTSTLTIRITTLEGFPTRAFRSLLHAAVALDADPTAPGVPKVKRPPLPLPDCLKAALANPRHKAAAAGFRSLSASCQREYIVWVSSAKRDDTRERRLSETLNALAGGLRWEHRKKTATSQ